MPKPIIFYRFSLAKDILSEMESNPREFLYGADQLIRDNKVEAIFVSKGKRNTILRKLLFLIEKPMTYIYFLGMPLELVIENWKKVKEAPVIFCINDAISFAVLFFKWLGLIKTPVIALLQSTSERHRMYFYKKKWAVRFLRKLIGKADLLLTLSEPARQEIIDIFDISPEKIRTFYFGIDDEYWKANEENREDYILSVGNDSNRDFKTLVSALGDKYKIKIVSRLKIDGSPNVEVLNGLSNDELKELYQKAALVVTPSRYVKTESSGLSSTLQGMSCGTPVLVSDSLPMREMFKEGEEILYFEPGNPDDLREKADTLFSNGEKMREIGRNGRAAVEKRYNTSRMGSDIYALIQEFLLK